MIKFFRNIRQKLVYDGNTGRPALPAGRYLKYAFGEIILVVIGILIALQINNWNSNRNEKLNEHKANESLKFGNEDGISINANEDANDKNFNEDANDNSI